MGEYLDYNIWYSRFPQGKDFNDNSRDDDEGSGNEIIQQLEKGKLEVTEGFLAVLKTHVYSFVWLAVYDTTEEEPTPQSVHSTSNRHMCMQVSGWGVTRPSPRVL